MGRDSCCDLICLSCFSAGGLSMYWMGVVVHLEAFLGRGGCKSRRLMEGCRVWEV